MKLRAFFAVLCLPVALSGCALMPSPVPREGWDGKNTETAPCQTGSNRPCERPAAKYTEVFKGM